MLQDNLSAVEVLVKAKERIANPSHWTKGEFARDICGNSVQPRNKTAVYFCVIGAIESIMEMPSNTYDSVFDLLYNALPTCAVGITAFNDNKSTTHQMIMKLFDDAINNVCLLNPRNEK